MSGMTMTQSVYTVGDEQLMAWRQLRPQLRPSQQLQPQPQPTALRLLFLLAQSQSHASRPPVETPGTSVCAGALNYYSELPMPLDPNDLVSQSQKLSPAQRLLGKQLLSVTVTFLGCCPMGVPRVRHRVHKKSKRCNRPARSSVSWHISCMCVCVSNHSNPD